MLAFDKNPLFTLIWYAYSGLDVGIDRLSESTVS